jgi:hypothetical protein
MNGQKSISKVNINYSLPEKDTKLHTISFASFKRWMLSLSILISIIFFNMDIVSAAEPESSPSNTITFIIIFVILGISIALNVFFLIVLRKQVLSLKELKKSNKDLEVNLIEVKNDFRTFKSDCKRIFEGIKNSTKNNNTFKASEERFDNRAGLDEDKKYNHLSNSGKYNYYNGGSITLTQEDIYKEKENIYKENANSLESKLRMNSISSYGDGFILNNDTELINKYNYAQTHPEEQSKFLLEYNCRRIGVVNSVEWRANKNIEKIFDEMPAGDFYAITLAKKSIELALVLPRFGLTISKSNYDSGAIGEVYECTGYTDGSKYRNFTVLKPAVFRKTAQEQWTLVKEKRGELQLNS